MPQQNPGVFDQLLANDAPFALDPDAGLGEWVTYTPAGGSGKTIAAVVNRASAALIGPADAATYPSITIVVSTADVPSINLNGDKVTLVPKIGAAAVALAVTGIITQDAGAHHLQLAGAQ